MSNDVFEVLSPWAETDPITARGISPRVSSLSGRRIGLYLNTKRAAPAMRDYLQVRLKERFPSAEFLSFTNSVANEVITKTPAKAAFEDWIKSVDTVIAMVGD